MRLRWSGMNGKTTAYLEIAALAEAGALLLDPRPAWVFRGDGSAILWANAAGAAFFGETTMAGLLDRRFSLASPTAKHLARLAKQAPADHPRLEVLRFGLGVREETLTAACRRLPIGAGHSILVNGLGTAARESLSTRAERLADLLSAGGSLAVVLDADGQVIGASGEFPTRGGAGIDGLVAEAVRGDRAVLKRSLPAGPKTARPAGIARISAANERLYLLIVGPEEDAPPATATGFEAPPGGMREARETAPEDAGTSAGRVRAGMPLPAGEAAPSSQPSSERGEGAAAAPDREPSRAADVPEEQAGEAGTSGAAAPGAVAVLPAGTNDNTLTVAGTQGAGATSEATTPAAAVASAPTEGAVRADDPAAAAPAGPATGEATATGSPRPAEEPGTAATTTPAPAAPPSPVTPPSEPRRPKAAGPTEDVDLDDLARRQIEQGSASNRAMTWPEPTAPAGPGAAAATAVEPVVEPTAAAPNPPAEETPPRAETNGEPTASPATLAAHQQDAAPTTADAPSPPPAHVTPPSNVVRLPGSPTRQPPPPRRLSGSERDAFRRIAEELGVRAPDAVETSPAATGDSTNDTAASGTPASAEAAAEPPGDRATRDAQAIRSASVPEQRAGEAPAEPPAAIDRAILDKLPIGIVVYRDGRTLAVNRTLLALLGYGSADAFAAAGGAAALFPDVDPASGGAIELRRADGTPARVTARLHTVTFGGAAALMLTVADRAERPAPPPAPAEPAHDAAAETRMAELEAILDTATDGVVVIDGDGRIVTFNRSAEALFGVAAAEVAGKPFTDLLAEESRRAALDYLDGLAANGVASVLNDGREVIGKVPAGGLIPLFMTMGRLGDSGKYCAVLRDITHWKNVEEELVAARKAAEAANAQKSDFLAKISHEIRTPLNAIIGFSEVMIEERFGPVGSDRYRTYLRDIHVSGSHLMSLINDLLDLSKIEAGKIELKSEAVAVNELIQECVALMQPQANRERIIIRTSLGGNVPAVVADLRSLRQILLNLLSNAVKFTGAGGQVIVATALEENGEVVIRIRDTGIGMTEKEIETAMKPYRQIATSGRQREGTGLGLPLTKALVEANRATFAIDSVPKQGTLVRVTFPTTRVLVG